jgi:hypothetical protein
MHSVHFQERSFLDRHSLSKRYQCQRHSKGYGPIRIRVILNSSVASAPAPEASTPAPELSRPATNEVCTKIDLGMEKKNKRALLVRRRLEQSRELKKVREDKDALQNQLEESKKKLKSTQEAVLLWSGHACQGNMKNLESSMNLTYTYI